MGEDVWGVVWLAVLLLGNAFFVGAEFAVISAARSQVEPKAEAGSRAARTTLWAMEHATLMLATSQLGITVCSLLILTVSEPAIHHLVAVPLGLTGLSAAWISGVSFGVALLVVTYLHVVLGEMVPKNLAFSLPDRAVLVLAPPLVWVSRVTRPVTAALNGTANLVLRMFRVEPKDEATSTFTLQEVAGIVEQSRREGTLPDVGGTLLRAFEFTDRRIRDELVPLADLAVLPAGCTPADVREAVVERGHSRLLVADDHGGLAGYLHMKDVMDFRPDQYDDPVPAKRLRRLHAVPVDGELEDALTTLRRHGSHVGRVVDSEGRTVGAIFLEDVLEVLVGKVSDAVAERPGQADRNGSAG